MTQTFRQTYTVWVFGNTVAELEEKAREKMNDVLGEGAYITGMDISKNIGPPFEKDLRAEVTTERLRVS